MYEVAHTYVCNEQYEPTALIDDSKIELIIKLPRNSLNNASSDLKATLSAM